MLKPGGHILAFSAARTYHHLAVTLEQAGFEIRDQIMWIYSSGFPKSQDIGKSIDRSAGKKNNLKRHDSPNKDNNGLDVGSGVKCPKCHKDSAARYDCKQDECGMIYKAQTPEAEQWLGWGTALKPAHEPIALARKPLHKNNSIARNCQQWGTGALNIDATRIPYENQKDIDTYLNNKRGPMERGKDEDGKNIRMFNGETGFKAVKREVTVEEDLPELGRFPSNVIGDIAEPYQKYFYCPKVSRKERHMGFPVAKGMYEIAREHGYTLAYDDPNDTSVGYMVDTQSNKVPDLVLQKLVEQYGGGNNHPTVKPIELMKYLIKLITPPGGTVLDPFNGSGSTGCAAVELGFEYIGCELDPAYVAITERRIAAWLEKDPPVNNFEDLFSGP